MLYYLYLLCFLGYRPCRQALDNKTMRGAAAGDVYDSRRDCQTVHCAGYSTCRGGYLRGLLTGLFKLIATFYMFDLDYPPVHSMFMGIICKHL